MADLPLRPSYSISPTLAAYEVTADRYLSQRAEFTGIVGAAIIIHNGRVLILQRASEDECPDVWEVPNGGAMGDETPIECAVRELKGGRFGSAIQTLGSRGAESIVRTQLFSQKHEDAPAVMQGFTDFLGRQHGGDIGSTAILLVISSFSDPEMLVEIMVDAIADAS
ncbi:uncharacterized protein KD926_008013 [Aspergillus affinis]|uniref:uncharacterized protein n=1 Tax=Aspergillus affinis TaxID=1070780 RepID=UPI0022FEED0D|nr:uncharacterized protein KD926_008013 [Aspergillus affinis]KAI9045597.1 hypothetical protein KD926_008013 [Aspergillus affinis]